MSDEGRLVAGRYRLVHRIGTGAMGVVWQAHDERLNRTVAVKQVLLQPGLSHEETEEALARSMREGRIAAKLHHPNAVSVFDVVAEASSKADYRGCAFMRASAEMSPDASGRQVCRDARLWTRALLSGLAKQAGAADPEYLASQLLLLYDGVAVSAQLSRDPAAARAAKAAATLLIDSACVSKSRSRRRRSN